MEIKYKIKDATLILFVYGELDECTASNAKTALDSLILNNANKNKVVFDLSGLSFMDSTGIGLLIGRYKKLKQFNMNGYITGASVATEKVIELSGLYKIMPKI